MELNEITIEDKFRLDKYFTKIKEPLSDTTFAMRFIWAEPLKHTWAIINSNLCFFGFLKDKYVLWGPPIGGNQLGKTIGVCFDIVKKLNKENCIDAGPTAIYIPECLAEDFETVAKESNYLFYEWFPEYVYKTVDLIELKGNKYKSQRNKLNIFARNLNISVEEFNFGVHGDGCLSLIELWRMQKQQTLKTEWPRYALDSVTEAANTLIKFSKELGVKGIVVGVNSEIIGMSIGESLSNEMCSNMIGMTDLRFKGASEFIWREFARYWTSHPLINVQDDFGIDYLKKDKLAYRPVKLLRSYGLMEKP